MKKRILSILLICLLTGFLLGVGRADALTGNATQAKQEETRGRDEAVERGTKEPPERDEAVEQGTKEPPEIWDSYRAEQAETAAEDEIMTRLLENMPVYNGKKGAGVSRLEGTEEDLLVLIYDDMKKWDNAGGRVKGQIDLSFEGLVLASLECYSARQIFIALPEGIYRISSLSFHDRNEWKELMQGKLEDVFGEYGLGREQTEQFFRSEGLEGQMVLWYKGLHYLFSLRRDQFLLSWERGEAGISFQEAYRGSGGEEGDDFSKRTFEFRRLEGLREMESGREMREQLQELCPGMKTCRIWAKNGEAFLAEADCQEAEGLVIYGTSGRWQGAVYQIRCTNREEGNNASGMERLMWENTGTDSYYWTGNEDAVLRERDAVKGYAVYRSDIGRGKPYTFWIHRVEEGETLVRYELAVHEEGEEQPLCKLEIREDLGGDLELSFKDLNGDGYKDVLLGDDGWVYKCYLWSASGEHYVEMTEALGGSFEYCRADEEKRQLQVYRNIYTYSGWGTVGTVYQWTGEMDCELLKEIHREPIYDRSTEKDWREITITVRKDGAEKVLMDYIYPYEEYSARAAELNEILDMDFVWEQEVNVNGEKEPCILRYAQEESREEDGTMLYTDRVFLFRWDTYLIGSYSGVVSSSPWEEIFMDTAGRLRVTYKDSSSVVYSREFYGNVWTDADRERLLNRIAAADFQAARLQAPA